MTRMLSGTDPGTARSGAGLSLCFQNHGETLRAGMREIADRIFCSRLLAAVIWWVLTISGQAAQDRHLVLESLEGEVTTNAAYYERITADAAEWFFSSARLVSVKGHNCYDWGYVLVNDPEEHREDTGHSWYDVYVLRAYEANLGPTRVQMQRLINTALFAINLGSNRFSGYVNGTISQYRPERKYLNYQWIEMSVLDRRLYEVLGKAVLDSHQYLEDLPVEAAVLYAKHHWATRAPEPEVVDTAKGAPPASPASLSNYRKWPRAVILMFF